jgi:tetratricopeptide (TPR) repeat protein
MQGRLDEAVARLESAAPVAMELGLVMSGMVGMEGVYVARLAGDPARAEAYARAAWEMYGSIGETGFRSTVGTQLAEVVADQGRLEEAEAILAEVETFVARDDFDPQARLRMVRARILAQRGELAEAERLVREAVGLVDVTDYVDLAGSAHADLAAVLELAGRHDEADAEWRTALGLYERKGNVVLGAQVRARLAT